MFDLLKWLEEEWKTGWWNKPAPVPEPEPEPDPQDSFNGMGDVVGYISGGYANWRDGQMHWTFYDQQGNELTSIPLVDYGLYVEDNKFIVDFVNGVPVWKVLRKK